MTGGLAVVSRIDSAGVYVERYPTLPGQELGPLVAVVHRVVVDSVDHITEYVVGDEVLVLEPSSNEFIVVGITTPAV